MSKTHTELFVNDNLKIFNDAKKTIYDIAAELKNFERLLDDNDLIYNKDNFLYAMQNLRAIYSSINKQCYEQEETNAHYFIESQLAEELRTMIH